MLYKTLLTYLFLGACTFFSKDKITYSAHEKSNLLYKEALDLLQVEKFKEATSLLTKAYLLDSTSRSVLLNLNYACTELKQYNYILPFLLKGIETFAEGNNLIH